MKKDLLHIREFSSGRHVPVDVWKMDDPNLILEEINSFQYDEDLIIKLFSALDYVSQNDCEKGFMVTGLFGVGASHFLKYVLFCLIPDYQVIAFSHLIQLTEDISLISRIKSYKERIQALSVEILVLKPPYLGDNFLPSLYFEINKARPNGNSFPIINDLPKKIVVDTVYRAFCERLNDNAYGYRFVLFFDDFGMCINNQTDALRQLHELFSKLFTQHGDTLRLFCSCQMLDWGSFEKDNPEAAYFYSTTMKRVHLSMK